MLNRFYFEDEKLMKKYYSNSSCHFLSLNSGLHNEALYANKFTSQYGRDPSEQQRMLRNRNGGGMYSHHQMHHHHPHDSYQHKNAITLITELGSESNAHGLAKIVTSADTKRKVRN